MIPNQYVAILSGGLLKLYDDSNDIPIYGSTYSKAGLEILKGLIIATFTYVSINNMNVPFVVFIFIGLDQLFIDDTALNTDFYYSGMILTFILLLITFDPDHVTHLVWIPIILASIFGYIEHKLFPEDYSWKKIIARTLVVLGLVVSKDIALKYFIDNDIICIAIGYFSFSVFNMLYLKYRNYKRNESELLKP